MLDDFRTRPRETLAGIIARRKERDPAWQTPISIRALEYMFLHDSKARDRFRNLALKLFGVKRV